MESQNKEKKWCEQCCKEIAKPGTIHIAGTVCRCPSLELNKYNKLKNKIGWAMIAIPLVLATIIFSPDWKTPTIIILSFIYSMIAINYIFK